MDVAGQLVSRIVDDERVTEVIKGGITEDFFDEDTAIIYKYITRHFDEYKAVPSRDAVLRAFPNFEFKEAKEPLEYYINEIKESYRRDIMERELQKAARIFQKDTKKAEKYVRSCLNQLQITEKSFKDINFIESVDDILDEYDEKKNNPGVDGIKSTWKTLDSETLGWHPGEFIVLAGEKYMGKSWIMIFWALQAALQGERALFVTREMSQIQVRRRLASLIAHVPFDGLRKGELTNSEEERFRERIKRLDENFHFFIAQNGVYTVDDMRSKAVEVDATIMFTDSVYLFQPDSRKEPLGEVQKRLAISQKCKSTAQDLKIPFAVSVQAGRRPSKKVEAPTLDNIEWSNAFSQDGDHVVFIQKDDLDKELHRSQVWALKVRDGQEVDFFINQDFEWMNFDERDDVREPTTQVFDEEEESIFTPK